jgi:hypothetical protein
MNFVKKDRIRLKLKTAEIRYQKWSSRYSIGDAEVCTTWGIFSEGREYLL